MFLDWKKSEVELPSGEMENKEVLIKYISQFFGKFHEEIDKGYYSEETGWILNRNDSNVFVTEWASLEDITMKNFYLEKDEFDILFDENLKGVFKLSLLKNLENPVTKEDIENQLKSLLKNKDYSIKYDLSYSPLILNDVHNLRVFDKNHDNFINIIYFVNHDKSEIVWNEKNQSNKIFYENEIKKNYNKYLEIKDKAFTF